MLQFAPKVACKATIPLTNEHHNLPPQASRLIDLTTLLRFLKSALNTYLRLLVIWMSWVLRNLLPRPRARIRTPAFRRSRDGPTTESLEIPSVIAISTLGQKIWLTAKYWRQIRMTSRSIWAAWVSRVIVWSLRKQDVDGSDNVTWKCNFAFLQSFLNYSKSLYL